MHNRLYPFIIAAATLTMLLTACTGLGGEPAIVATIPAAQSQSTATAVAAAPTLITTPDVGYAQSAPDLANGAAIYAQRCASCHGVGGAGDGELVVSGQVQNPGNFRDPTSARGQTPKDWFNTITNGNIENLMPPWKDALTEQQRWDVTMYTYTLHYTAEEVELGRQLYYDCADCHGETGRGDGPEAGNIERQVKDLTNQQAMSTLSDQHIYNLVSEGQFGVMPAYAGQFDEESLRAVVAYSRTLSLANVAQVIVTQTTPEITAQPAAFQTTPVPATNAVNITGRIENLTAGGTVPAGLTVTLRVFDADTLAPLDERTRTTTLGAENAYRFDAVLREDDKLYLTAVEYQGRNFASGLFPGTQSAFDLPISLYELTDDPAVVTMRAAVSQVEVGGDTMEVVYSVQFVNTSDRLFTQLQAEADGRYKSVALTLPPGSLVVGLPDQPRYIVAEDQMTVWDTQPLQPGEERFLQVTYLLSYTDGAVIEYPLPYVVDGQVRVLVQPETISLVSDLLSGHGTETLGNEQYQGYGDPLTLPAGSLIRYTLNGTAPDNAILGESGSSSNVVASDNLLLVLAGTALMLSGAVFVGYWVMRLRRQQQLAAPVVPSDDRSRQRLIDGLVRQIAELDAQHDAGQINHDVYRNRRDQLKTRLAELMDAPKS